MLEKRTNRLSRWIPWIPAALAVPWWIASAYFVPPLIQRAYDGISHPLLNRLISGQAEHIVDRYLHYWQYLVWLGMVALLGSAVVAVLTEWSVRNEWLTPRRGWLLTVGVVMPAAAALRWFHLTDRSLSFDETYSVALAGSSWGAFLEALQVEKWNAITYYILLRAATVFGDAEWVVRGLSVVLGVALIPVLYLLGKRLYGPACGLAAAGLMAVQGFHVEWSQKARPYALAALLAALATLLFLRAVERPTKRIWAGYAVLMLLGLYSHAVLMLLLVAHGAALFFLPRREIPWKHVLASFTFLGIIGALPRFFSSMEAAERMVYLELFSWPGLLGVLKSFAGKGDVMLLGFQLLLVVAALGYIFRSWWTQWGSTASWRFAVVTCWFVVPLSLVMCLSTFLPLLVDRGLTPFLPALVLLCGLGISVLRPRVLAATAFAVLATLAVSGLVILYEFHGIEEWRWATAQFSREAQPGDAVLIFHPARYIPFTYHLRRGGHSLDGIEIYLPPPADQAVVRHELSYRMEIPDDLGDRLAARHRRVWVVFSHENTPGMGRTAYRDELLRQVRTHYRLVRRHYFPMVQLYRYELGGQTAGGTPAVTRAAAAYRTAR